MVRTPELSEARKKRGNTGEQLEFAKAVNQQVAAWVVGTSPNEFRDLGPPRNNDGTYNLRDVVQFMADKDGGEASDKARKLKASADREEMRRDEEAGRLVRVEVARERLGRMVEALKSAIAVLDDRSRQVIADALDKGLAEW